MASDPWLVRMDKARRTGTIGVQMFRYFRALDPGRSLATAVAWLAVALSLAVALALVAVGNYAENSMLAQRDAMMMRFAVQFAGELQRGLANPRAAAPLGLPPHDRL